MAFTGHDYHLAFEEACAKLPFERDPDAVRSELEGIEWILWEAIRGVFFYVAVLTGGLIVLPVLYLLNSEKSLIPVLIATLVMLIIATGVYWLCRLVFRFEITAHVKGRRFGSGGLDRPPEMWAIAENLHRLDLTKDERDRQIRRYAELLKDIEAERVHSGHSDAIESKREDGRGHRPEGVATKIANETGLNARTVRRVLSDKPKPTAIERRVVKAAPEPLSALVLFFSRR
jgi:hypothetical protein